MSLAKTNQNVTDNLHFIYCTSSHKTNILSAKVFIVTWLVFTMYSLAWEQLRISQEPATGHSSHRSRRVTGMLCCQILHGHKGLDLDILSARYQREQ